MKPRYWWIKERHNPQIGFYYIAEGKITVKEARARENPVYGTNYMHRFDTEEAYIAACEQWGTGGPP